MSLFQDLYAWQKGREDYLTKILCWLFQQKESKDLVIAWVHSIEKALQLEPGSYTAAHVTCQKFEPGCYFDLCIQLDEQNGPGAVMVVEAKIGLNGEKPGQLNKYARKLAGPPYSDCSRRILLYLTQIRDPKDKHKILQWTHDRVYFHQQQWHDLYKIISAQDGLAHREVAAFIKEECMNNMTFSTRDLSALQSFFLHDGITQFMNLCLEGDVRRRFDEVNRGKSPAEPEANQEYSFYMRTTKWNDNLLRWLAVGFDFSSETEGPKVQVVFQLNCGNKNWANYLPALNMLASVDGWKESEMEGEPTPEDWLEVIHSKKLSDFLPDQSDTVAIQKYFLERLDEFEQVQKRFPRLKWNH